LSKLGCVQRKYTNLKVQVTYLWCRSYNWKEHCFL